MPGYVLGTKAGISPLVMNRLGARWYKNQSSPVLTRLYQAEGKSFFPSVGSTAGYSDFDTLPIYKDIKLCNVANGAVTAYEGEPAFSRTPATGDVMVEIPRFYYKIEDTETYRDYIISDQPLPGYSVSPRHAPHAGKANGYEKIYVSVYTLNSNYRSLSGEDTLTDMRRDEMREGCASRGAGYYLYDFATHWTICLLYLVEVANWDSQVAVGRGRVKTGNTEPIATGSTDNLATHTGRADTDADEQNNGVKYRHIENLWGNMSVWMDGLNLLDNDSYVSTNPTSYADDTATGYTKLSYSRSLTAGYISKLGLDETVPWAQLCTEAAGTSTTYIPDNYTGADGWRVALTGGFYASNAPAGLFYIYMGYVSASKYNIRTGGRLIYLP